jgi:hypothetical protein
VQLGTGSDDVTTRKSDFLTFPSASIRSMSPTYGPASTAPYRIEYTTFSCCHAPGSNV